MKRIFFILLIFIISVLSTHAFAQSITVLGSDWNVPTPAVPTEAGSDYNPNLFESIADLISISVYIPTSWFDSKTVNVKWEGNPNWNAGLKLHVKKTKNPSVTPGGCLFCGFSGGSDYIEVLNSNKRFFEVNNGIAAHTFANAEVQVKISGVSVAVPTGSYNAKLVFTITD
ncbi:MAG: hypothetical protein E6Q95_05655 [Chitinophagaceae bacterium]|nr:MAG: hypothetical protein E6Q95_05655 [Chitinophagaceae bacterium]